MQPRFYTKRCCSSSSNTIAEAVANIDDLLTEILMRVPARPLVRFKCVSKHWLSLISDPKFCHHHTLRNPKPPVSAVFAGRSTEFSFVPLDLYYDPHCNHGNQNICSHNFNPLKFVQHLHDIVVLQSCNGLFLCCSLTISEATYSSSSVRTTRSFYVLNPTTNQFITLILPAAVASASASASASAQLFGYALAFDPSKSPHYKVVFLRTITERAVGNFCPYYHIHIYSSENRSWRLLNSSFVRLPNVFYKQGVYCNGAVHWVGMDDEIAYYHIDDERVKFLHPPRPPTPIKSRNSRYFQASHCGSHLQLVDIYETRLTRFEVLEMGKDYSGWILKYHLDLDPKLAPFPCLKSDPFTVLFLVPEEVEGEESASMLLHFAGKVISYNFKSSIFKSFELPSRPGVDDSKLRVYDYGRHQYMETLACV